MRLSDLRRLRVVMKRAQPFLITADRNPALAQLDRAGLAARTRPGERQLLLFETARSATSGEF